MALSWNLMDVYLSSPLLFYYNLHFQTQASVIYWIRNNFPILCYVLSLLCLWWKTEPMDANNINRRKNRSNEFSFSIIIISCPKWCLKYISFHSFNCGKKESVYRSTVDDECCYLLAITLGQFLEQFASATVHRLTLGSLGRRYTVNTWSG